MVTQSLADTRRQASMTPRAYRVASRQSQTSDVVTLLVEPVDDAPMAFAAGQFNMLYAYAVGEVAVSISGSPLAAGPIMHTVRDVGPVSHALCGLQPGDSVGVRGPFGSDWGVASARGHDLVIIAGGIGLAPLRPVITQLIAERERFGDVEIVIGARKLEELPFRDDIDAWRARDDLSVHVTVDRASPGWTGTVGVVTTVLPRVRVGPDAVAMLCGPEVMMRVTALALLERGLPPARIRLSMERNMQCAIAQCGHCQLGSAFVCKDGPVLTWARVEPLLGVREL
jgi:NAD(P)H-flavin reductase